MHGCHGRILVADLDHGACRAERLPEDILRRYLGGRGLAAHLLCTRNPAGADPLGPDNHLIFATGPFTGTMFWGGSRYGVYAKSPLTGGWAESYSGGRVPEALDAAGYDAVVIRGRAGRPVVLVVTPDGCEVREAGDLWGLDTERAEAEALARFAPAGPDGSAWPRLGAVVIGPAGERLVPFAMIANDRWHCAGRTGMGAVMGSKGVKAVIFAGDRKRGQADPDGARAYARDFMRRNRDTPGVKAYKAQGTTLMVALMNTAGAFPGRYWTEGSVKHWEAISGDHYHADHDIEPSACAKCFVACGRKARMTSGRREGLVIEGPEYETIYAFGGLCMVDDITEIAHLNDVCDKLGLDTISAGNLCGLAMAGRAADRLPEGPVWGDVDAIEALLVGMSDGTGLGGVLGKGITAAARELNLEDLAVHVKGLEPAGYDPRKLKGMGLTYATSPRGACHLRTTFYKPELAGMSPPDELQGKAGLLVEYEDRLTIFDCLVLCRFFRDMYTWEELERSIALATGLEPDTAALRTMAAHITDLTRAFNLREGLTPEDDRLPRRLTKVALPSGHTLTEDDMAHLLLDYYRERGWTEDGRPAVEDCTQ